MVVSLGVLGGCQSSGPPPIRAIDAYEGGDYPRAYRLATEQYNDAGGSAADRSALVAGLSAHAMGRTRDAERWLDPLRSSGTPGVAGRAGATVGLIALSRGDYERASALLERSTRRLEGEASARAHYHAAEAFALGGRPETARLHLRLALAQSLDPDLRTAARDRLDNRAYTVQLGAFSSIENAQRSAQEVGAAVRAVGLDAPLIVEHRSAAGRTLYLVQAGTFATRAEAERVRVQLRRNSVVTTVEP